MTPAPNRPRISRETRLLLTTALLAVAALWVLARIRFPERPFTPNPVQPLLSQLNARPAFTDLADELAQLQPRIAPLVQVVEVQSGIDGTTGTLALRTGAERGVALTPALPAGHDGPDPTVIAHDPASGLAVLRVGPTQAPAPPATVVATRPDQPRFAVATGLVGGRVALRPVFIGALEPAPSPLWSEPVWLVPRGTDIAPGSFLFTTDAELLGLVVTRGIDHAILPGASLLAEAERLATQPARPRGELGIEVQPLTPSLAAATGAPNGVVVAWVDRTGPSAGKLQVGDVIEAAGGTLLTDQAYWDARRARLSDGEPLALLVRRGGTVIDVSLEARAAPPPEATAATPVLGVVLRAVRGVGVEVVQVMPGSAAGRAGLAPGDLITLVADTRSPTPSQVAAAFAAMRAGRPLLVAVTRGSAHHVLTLER